MATTVKITETYDMKTTVNQLGLIAVHTPSTAFLVRQHPGLVKSHKFVRLLKCDVVGACASVLPADPLQVGVEAGDVAPEDMFNPILYRAMSNESFETLLSRMYALSDINAGFGSVASGTIGASQDSFKTYYALLSENKGWRKVMPQQGFSIRGLYPICYQMINTFGNLKKPGQATVLPQGTSAVSSTDDISITSVGSDSGSLVSQNSLQAITFRGRSVKMPKIPIHYYPENSASPEASSNWLIPKTYVLAMVVPPARLHEFYYRMRVTWTIRFEQVVSASAIGGTTAISGVADASYKKSYTFESSKAELEHNESSVDTNGVSINKIMES